MITIVNKQRKIACNIEQLTADAQTLLQLLNYSDFDLGILLTTESAIKKYNRDYRHKDAPTDILSFPYHANLKAGRRIKVAYPEDKNLGDLIIAPAYVVKDAKKLGVTFENRMQRLLVHGICHLLGYDHMQDADYAVMLKKEKFLLKHLGGDTNIG
jgi:probable rRNA maturation factor